MATSSSWPLLVKFPCSEDFNVRQIYRTLFIGALTLSADAANSQQPLPASGSSPAHTVLTLSRPEQVKWFKAMERHFRVHVVHRGRTVRSLPVAARQISPHWTDQGKTWSIDDWMRAYRVSGVIVLKDGSLLLERYGLGRRSSERWTSFSVAKSVTSLLAGAAIRDGKLSLDDTVERFVPELKNSAYQGVTLRELLTMSSGVRWYEDYTDTNSDVIKLSRTADERADNLLDYLKTLPRAHPPGSIWHYNTAETHLAGLVIARAVGMSLSDYLSERIWRPYGMEQDAVWVVDKQGREQAGCCLSMTLRDYARVGQFALDDGIAEGRVVLPRGWIAESTSVRIANDQPAPAGYGYFWWIGARAYEASGIFGQSILVYPKEHIVIAVNSAWPQAVGNDLFRALHQFQGAVHDAAAPDAAKVMER